MALLSTFACCIALPAPARAAPDDAHPAAKSSKTKPSSSGKGSSANKSSTKSTGKSSKTSKGSSKSTASRSSAKKPSKATTSAKKPSPVPPAKAAAASDAVRAAFDPAAPTAAGIPGAPAATASAATPGQRGPTRIDFDDRLIQGQRNTAGAVYLYDRKELKQRSMIKKRESFREEIVGAVYDSEL